MTESQVRRYNCTIEYTTPKKASIEVYADNPADAARFAMKAFGDEWKHVDGAEVVKVDDMTPQRTGLS